MTGNPAKAPKVKSSPKTTSKVWWWDIVGHDKPNEVTYGNISLWADSWCKGETMRERHIARRPFHRFAKNEEGPFPEGEGPECFYFSNNIQEFSKPGYDLNLTSSNLIIVSGKMIDLLQDFDLGASVIHELPLFYGKEDKNSLMGWVPDLTRQAPGRWGFLQMLERKNAFLPEQSKGFRKRYPEDPTDLSWGRNYEGKLQMKMDTQIATQGVDLWKEKHAEEFIGFSDRLKVAMKEAGIVANMLTHARPVKLV